MSAPRFAEVPEYWKYPVGPYRQAPAEYGGEWWLVSPFTSSEPWLIDGATITPRELPAGFVAIFGTRPKIGDFAATSNPGFAWRVAVDLWEQDLRYFKRAGVPDWASTEQVAVAAEVTRAWGLGAAKFYEGRYGWMARFPESLLRDFESSAWGALNVAHHVIAGYQMRLIERDVVPEKRHPFVPPHLWPEDQKASN